MNIASFLISNKKTLFAGLLKHPLFLDFEIPITILNATDLFDVLKYTATKMYNVHLFPVELTLIMQLKAQEEADHVLLIKFDFYSE